MFERMEYVRVCMCGDMLTVALRERSEGIPVSLHLKKLLPRLCSWQAVCEGYHGFGDCYLKREREERERECVWWGMGVPNSSCKFCNFLFFACSLRCANMTKVETVLQCRQRDLQCWSNI